MKLSRRRPAGFTGDGFHYPRFLRMGSQVEGQPIVMVYRGDTARAVIGHSVRVGSDVELVIGGNHRADWVTTYPLREMFELPGAYIENPVTKGDIFVGDGVQIGRGSRILSGVHIGKDAVVMPYSVVARDVLAGTVVAGNPARPLPRGTLQRDESNISEEASVNAVGARLGAFARVRGFTTDMLRSWARMIDEKPQPSLPNKVDAPIDPPPVTMGTASYAMPIVHSARGADVRVKIGNYSSLSYDVECLFSGLEVHRRAFEGQSPVALGVASVDEKSSDEISLGSDVWVGRGARLLGGVSVGHGSVVAAYAVVVDDVRPYAIVAGNPAREVGRRFDDATVDALLRIQWWNWPQDDVLARWSEFCSTNLADFIERYDI